MNKNYGADTYALIWRKDSDYVCIQCKVQDCINMTKFSFEECDNSGQPINLTLSANVCQSHRTHAHKLCRLKYLKSDLILN